jgi:uncharacterized membrane protein YqhA
MISRLLRSARYITGIGVFFSLLASAALFVRGGISTIEVLHKALDHSGNPLAMEIAMVEIMDQFLVATGLIVFGLGLYELFIQPLALPPALTFRNLQELKTSLANIIILVLAVRFLKAVESGTDAERLLQEGVAISVVSAVLIAFRFVGEGRETNGDCNPPKS